MKQPLTAQQQKKLVEQHLAAGRSAGSAQNLRAYLRLIILLAAFSLILGFLCAWRGFAQGLIFGGAALVGYSIGRVGIWLVKKRV